MWLNNYGFQVVCPPSYYQALFLASQSGSASPCVK